MPQDTTTPTLSVGDRHAGWSTATILDFLTDAAWSIGVGSTTDAGWAPPAPAGTTPIMMTGGIPDPDTLPRHELLDAMKKVLHTSHTEALRYGGTQGYEALRF